MTADIYHDDDHGNVRKVSTIPTTEEVIELPTTHKSPEAILDDILTVSFTEAVVAAESLERSIKMLRIIEPNTRYQKLLRDMVEYLNHVQTIVDMH